MFSLRMRCFFDIFLHAPFFILFLKSVPQAMTTPPPADVEFFWYFFTFSFFLFFKICTTGDDDSPPGICGNCGEEEYLCAHCDFVSFFFSSPYLFLFFGGGLCHLYAYICNHHQSPLFYCANCGEDEYICAHCAFVIFFLWFFCLKVSSAFVQSPLEYLCMYKPKPIKPKRKRPKPNNPKPN